MLRNLIDIVQEAEGKTFCQRVRHAVSDIKDYLTLTKYEVVETGSQHWLNRKLPIKDLTREQAERVSHHWRQENVTGKIISYQAYGPLRWNEQLVKQWLENDDPVDNFKGFGCRRVIY